MKIIGSPRRRVDARLGHAPSLFPLIIKTGLSALLPNKRPYSSEERGTEGHFISVRPRMTRKKITGDELSARAKANGYQKGAHREEDGRRNRNKHIDKVKKDQDAALDRYVL